MLVNIRVVARAGLVDLGDERLAALAHDRSVVAAVLGNTGAVAKEQQCRSALHHAGQVVAAVLGDIDHPSLVAECEADEAGEARFIVDEKLYQPTDERAEEAKRDPITRMAAWLAAEGLANESELEGLYDA